MRQVVVLGGRPKFDFSNATLPSGATLTRSSIGTRTNISGVIVTETNDVARFDYDPITHALRGLLVERAATNFQFPSQNPSDAAWAANGATAKGTMNQADPFGGTTGTPFTASGTNAAHYVSLQTQVFVSGTAYGFSIFVQPNATALIQITADSGTFDSANFYANFSLSGAGSRTAKGSAVTAANIQAYDNGWYRIDMTGSANASGSSTAMYVAFITSGTDLRVPTNTSAGSVLLTGFQLEATSPTSYIPTTSGGVARSSDALTLNWAQKGVADGTITVRYTFDDLTTQDASTSVSSGTSTVPTNLNRSRILRAAKV